MAKHQQFDPTCPRCGAEVKERQNEATIFDCRTFINACSGTTPYQSTECKLRCELAEANNFAEESIEALTKERDEARAQLAEAYAAILIADSYRCGGIDGEWLGWFKIWTHHPAVKRAKEENP